MDDTIDNPQERPDAELGWLAGCFESDGWFSLHKNKMPGGTYQYQPVCGLVNSDSVYMASAIRILKKYKLPHHICTRSQLGLGKKNIHQIQIQGLKRCKRILPVLMPYLRSSKIERASIMLEFIEYRLSCSYNQKYGEVEDEMYARFHSPNQITVEGIFNDYTPDPTTVLGRDSLVLVETLRGGQK